MLVVGDAVGTGLRLDLGRGAAVDARRDECDMAAARIRGTRRAAGAPKRQRMDTDSAGLAPHPSG